MESLSQGINDKQEPKGGYTIGLDIGTSSVGWAVIDNNFNLVRGHKRIIEIDAAGKSRTRKSRTNLWGARLFSKGETAQKRRLQRGTRRRLARRTKRLQYLQAIFAAEMNKFDDSFFIRLQESFYKNEDTENKTIQTRYPLFHGKKGAGETYETDQDYYKVYPTIYHLRARLMNDASQADLRLVYLALHHILKFRGHFLNQGEMIDLKNIDIVKSFETLHAHFAEFLNENFSFESEKMNEALTFEQKEEIQKILHNREKSNAQKAHELTEYLASSDASREKQQKALYAALVGNGIDLANMFAKTAYSDKEVFPQKGTFKYASATFEEEFAKIESEVEPEELTIILEGKKVYDAIVLSNILTKPTLAESMVEKYDKHASELQELKGLAKSISDEFYSAIFKTNGIYTAYVAGVGNPAKDTTREDFYKALKKAFEAAVPNLKFSQKDNKINFENVLLSEVQKSSLAKMQEAIKSDKYLLKQRTNDNGAIPYQVHESELEKIIDNQKQYYPFLGEQLEITQETEAGEIHKKAEYKIQILMKFRIPYYVGPLAKNVGWVRDDGGNMRQTGSQSVNSWLVRKNHEKLTPWNFDEVIDKEASAGHFIERMTGFCTYLPQEKVLPKNSLLYQEFTIYNELMSCGYYMNNHKKEYFLPELKQEIVEKLFKKYKKVTAKKMREFLENTGVVQLTSDKQLFGIDTHVKDAKYNTSFSAYIDLLNAGIAAQIIDENRDIFEEIIKWQTIFEDKKSLKKRIKTANEAEWNRLLTTKQIDQLAKKHYTGWGNVSRELLSGRKTTQKLTIIEHLRTRKYKNFRRLLEDDNIKDAIAEAQVQDADLTKMDYEVVEKLAGSPKIKRGIWQALQVIKELERYLGVNNIARIVIEMARDNSGGRTKSRKKQIEAYQKVFETKTGEQLENALKEECSQQDEHAFANERVYLYFLQNGKSMYSDKELSLDALSMYEVDHIIPQTYIKDDSIDNKVLVYKGENQKKEDDVPSEDIVFKMRNYWELLAKNGQVSPKKLANLTRGKLTDTQKKEFINRQLVETRQITKHLANILTAYFKDKHVEILTPKAQLTSQFRDGVIYIPGSEYSETFEDNIGLKVTQEDSTKIVKVELHKKWHKNRDLNDYHHAHDAYLNAVVATYLYAIRSDLREHWVYGSPEKEAKKLLGKYADQRRKTYRQLLSGMINKKWQNIDENTGEIYSCYPDVPSWDRDEVIAKISRILTLRNINIVKKTELLDGQFSDESIYKADKKAKNFANGIKKQRRPELYGGTKAPVSAVAVAVRNENNEIKTLSIPVMYAPKYLNAHDRLKYLRSLYPDEKIKAIVRPIIRKYTKYILPNGTVRLMASYQEASNGLQLPMGIDKSDEIIVMYQKLARFIQTNKLFIKGKKISVEERLALLNDEGKITEYFRNAAIEEQQNIIKEMMRITQGSNQNLNALKASGLGTTAQQLDNKDNQIIDGTWLIDQSITGLYETRRQL